MQNTSKLNTVLLVIIIILLGVGIFIFSSKNNAIDNNEVNKQGQEAEDVVKDTYSNQDRSADINNAIVKNTSKDSEVPAPVVKNQVKYVSSPKFGISYPSGLNIMESYQDNTGKQVNTSNGSTKFFSATFGINQDAIIAWDGNSKCTDSEFGVFQYGISSNACLKGTRAWISHASASSVMSKEDLKTFGDFVIKNQ